MNIAAPDLGRLRQARESDIFTTITPSQWGDRLPPRRDWMVERAFVRGSVGLVSGDGGIGKSLLMQQLLTCAVMGRPFLGLSCQAGRALFLACEDDQEEVERRQYDINRHLGVGNYDVGEAGLHLAVRSDKDNELSRLDRREWRMVPTMLFTRLLERCLDLGISYVVIDTATQTFAGNQNDEQQVVQFVNQLRRLAIAIQGLVLITKHPSMAGRALGTGESGSVSWNNAVRSRFYLHRDKTQGLLLEAKKSNYGPADLKLPIMWQKGAYVPVEPASPAWNQYRDD